MVLLKVRRRGRHQDKKSAAVAGRRLGAAQRLRQKRDWRWKRMLFVILSAKKVRKKKNKKKRKKPYNFRALYADQFHSEIKSLGDCS